MAHHDRLIKITVRFEARDDGGLSVWSDDLPGLHLSHRDAALVIEDVPSALAGLMTDHGRLFKDEEVG
jgi:hypothetical protein